MKKLFNWFASKFLAVKMFLWLCVRTVKYFFVRKYRGIKNYFHNKHAAFLMWIIQFLIFHCSKYMVKLLLLKGKDPNYEFPPPPPPPPPPAPPRKTLQIPYVPAWVAESFKDKNKHPIFNRNYASKVTKEPTPVEVVLSQAGSDDNKVVVEPLMVSRGSLSDVLTKEQKNRATDLKVTELLNKMKDEE